MPEGKSTEERMKSEGARENGKGTRLPSPSALFQRATLGGLGNSSTRRPGARKPSVWEVYTGAGFSGGFQCAVAGIFNLDPASTAQRSMSGRAGATVTEATASHSVYVSQPVAVAAIIKQAASAVAARQ